MVEKEDEQVTLKRLEQEKKDREELDNALNNMDLSWEQRKEKERELLAKKRRRKSKSGADGEQKPKRRRRRQYQLIGED